MVAAYPQKFAGDGRLSESDAAVVGGNLLLEKYIEPIRAQRA